MCQSRAQGGRRCAAHMAATRGMRSLVGEATGLRSAQVNATFSALRAEGRGRPEPSIQEYANFLNVQFRRIDNAENLDSAARQRMRGIFASAAEENRPDGPTYYAYTRLLNTSQRQARALQAEIANLSTQMGVTNEEANRQFWTHYASPVESAPSAPAGYAEANTSVSAISRGLPSDPATSRAYETLYRSAHNNETNPNIAMTRRVNRREVQSSFISSIGYDAEDGRMEVTFHANPDRVYAYRNVPASTWERMNDGSSSLGSVYSREVRNNPDHQYATTEDAETDAFARRCAHCGQFRAVSHVCPQSQGEIEEPRVAEPSLSTVAATSVEEDVPNEEEGYSENTFTAQQQASDDALATLRARLLGEEAPAVEIDHEIPLIPADDDYWREDSLDEDDELADWERDLLAGNDELARETENDAAFERLRAAITADSPQSQPLRSYEEPELADWERDLLGLNDEEFANEEASSSQDEIAAPSSEDASEGSEQAPEATEAPRRRRVSAPRLSAAQRRMQLPYEERPQTSITSQRTQSIGYVYEDSENRESLGLTATSHSIDINSPSRIRTAVNRGDVALANLYISNSGRRFAGGYEYSSSTSVPVGIYKDENGQWQTRVQGNPRCTCEAYRNNSECVHVDGVVQNIGNWSTQIFKKADPNGFAAQTAVANAQEGQPVVINVAAAGRRSNAATVLGARVRGNGAPATLETDITGFPHNFTTTASSRRYYYSAANRADEVNVPTAADIRSALSMGDANIDVSWSGYRSSNAMPSDLAGIASGHFSVSGNVQLTRNDDGAVAVRSRNLRCSCSQYQRNYHCVHVDYVSNQSPRFATRGAARTQVEIGQINSMAEHMAEQARNRDWANDQERLAEQAVRHANVEPEDSYSQTYTSFAQDFAQAQEKINAGQSPLSFVEGTVTDGVCAPGGRKFGVELEFDLAPGVDRYTAIENIGREMHAAGLTSTPDQQRYHAGARSGYQDWSFETDSTVTGEIVSPIMQDTPEHWQQLKQVCDIIKRNGGVATTRTGSHVHVSTGSFGSDVEKHAEVANLVNQHEDTIYRLATNPESGTHRPMSWCAPNAGFNAGAVENARESSRNRYGYSRPFNAFGASHSLGINFESATGSDPNKDNIEFRQWDGTLDPAVIQTQVAISAGIVEAAERNVSTHGSISRIMREDLGSHASAQRTLLAGSRRRLTEDETKSDTASTRSFFDTIFTSREAKSRATALFAMTKWQNHSQ